MKRHLERFFNEDFARERRKAAKKYRFQTLKPAINAFLKHQNAKGVVLADTDTGDPASAGQEWREAVQPVREETPDVLPLPHEETKERSE